MHFGAESLLVVASLFMAYVDKRGDGLRDGKELPPHMGTRSSKGATNALSSFKG